MSKRMLILCAVVAAGLLAVLLLRGGGADQTPRAEPAHTVDGTARANAGAAELDLSSDDAPPAQRESAVQTRRAERAARAAERAARPMGTLVVRAVDKQSRAPLAGTRISIYSSSSGLSVRVNDIGHSRGKAGANPITATDGSAEFELPAGADVTLWAEPDAEDVGSAQRDIPQLASGERRELTIELPTGKDLHYFGRVVAREGKSAIADAKIEVLHQEKASTTTNADGLFELLVSSWMGPELKIHAPGFSSVFVQLGIGHDTPEEAKLIELSRSASLRAQLLDASGAPLSGTAVNLWTESFRLGIPHRGELYLPLMGSLEEWISDPNTSWKASADPSGTCTLEQLPPNVPLHVELIRGEEVVKRDLTPLVLLPGEQREVVWRIGAGCLLEGVVLDDRDAPVRFRKIWLKRADRDQPRVFVAHEGFQDAAAETLTNEEGRFRFSDVSSGKWWLGPAAMLGESDAFDPEGIATVAELIAIPEGAARHEIRLRVYRGLYIRGRVLDPAGEPAASTGVYGVNESETLFFSGNSASDGTFVLGPLVPGRYSLAALAMKYGQSTPIEASGGDGDVVLRLRAGGSLRGTVVDGTTGRNCVAELMFSRQGRADWGSSWGTETTQAGVFVADALAPGIYDIVARASGQRVGILRDVSIQPGIELRDLVLTLVAGSTLRLRNAAAEDSVRFRVSSDGASVASGDLRAGEDEVLAVPSGLIVVEWGWNPADASRKQIEIAVGEQKELLLGGD